MSKKTAKNAAPVATVNAKADKAGKAAARVTLNALQDEKAHEVGSKLAAAFTTAQDGIAAANHIFAESVKTASGQLIGTVALCAGDFVGYSPDRYDANIKPHVVAALAKAFKCEPNDVKVSSPASRIKVAFLAFANGLSVTIADHSNFQKFVNTVARPFVAAAFPAVNAKGAGRKSGTTGKDAQSLDKTLKAGKVDATDRAKACRVLAHVGDADVSAETLRSRAAMLNKCVLQGNKLFWMMVADIAGKLDK